MSEPDVLELHGTKVGGLKPMNVVQAAQSDLRLRDRKEHGCADPAEHYAFHRDHVAEAESVAGLIDLALADRTLGMVSGKKNTRLIYRDEDLLLAAREAA